MIIIAVKNRIVDQFNLLLLILLISIKHGRLIFFSMLSLMEWWGEWSSPFLHVIFHKSFCQPIIGLSTNILEIFLWASSI